MNEKFVTQEEYKEILKGDLVEIRKKFIKTPEGRIVCAECLTQAKTKKIAHPIWDGPFDGAGQGKCDYRELPFCPCCQGEQPQWEQGAAIRIPYMPGKDFRIMKRLRERLIRKW